MKNTMCMTAMLTILAMTAGCATPYLRNRGRDARDIFTATVGNSFGAKARMGPFHAGLYMGTDLAGLRAGEFAASFDGIDPTTLIDLECTLLLSEAFRPQGFSLAEQRGKLFEGGGVLGLSMGMPSHSPSTPTRPLGQFLPYYTQCEVAVGLLAGVRLGINPGELLDFVLGWTTLDIFQDDIETERREPDVAQSRPPK
jgi:hypothetical protein